jgi:hypothetical protein
MKLRQGAISIRQPPWDLLYASPSAALVSRIGLFDRSYGAGSAKEIPNGEGFMAMAF